MHYVLAIVLCAALGGALSFDMTLENSGFNYLLPLSDNGTIRYVVVDTGNASLGLLNSSNFVVSKNGTQATCLTYVKDETPVRYTGDCFDGTVSMCLIDAADQSCSGTEVSYSGANSFSAVNMYLHDWSARPGVGVLGMAYCTVADDESSTCDAAGTPFISLLYSSIYGDASSAADSLIFGLDMNTNVTSSVCASYSSGFPSGFNTVPPRSTMQVGEVASEYAALVEWSEQPQNTSIITQHTFQMQSLTLLCNNNYYGDTDSQPANATLDADTFPIGVFSNWTNTWPAVVDTGSVCLTLPAQFYDTLAAWINTTFVELDTLPVLSFKMSNGFYSEFDIRTDANGADDNSTLFYIPLANLVVNNDVLVNDTVDHITLSPGTGGSSPVSLCVLKSTSISPYSSDADDNALRNPVVMGSLVLQSVYFTANMATGDVGLANKYAVNSTNVAPYVSTELMNSLLQYGGQCIARDVCIGDQTYSSADNKCMPPECRLYFFSEIDASTQTCYYPTNLIIVCCCFVAVFIFCDLSAHLIGEMVADKQCLNGRIDYLHEQLQFDIDNPSDGDDGDQLNEAAYQHHRLGGDGNEASGQFTVFRQLYLQCSQALQISRYKVQRFERTCIRALSHDIFPFLSWMVVYLNMVQAPASNAVPNEEQ